MPRINTGNYRQWTADWSVSDCICNDVCIAAVFITLKSILVVDLLGLDKLTTAYGILSLLEGVGSLAGTPLIGTFSILLFLWWFHLYTVSQKTVQNCFCQNFVKFPPILIILAVRWQRGSNYARCIHFPFWWKFDKVLTKRNLHSFFLRHGVY